jgi:hypothetical protein
MPTTRATVLNMENARAGSGLGYDDAWFCLSDVDAAVHSSSREEWLPGERPGYTCYDRRAGYLFSAGFTSKAESLSVIRPNSAGTKRANLQPIGCAHVQLLGLMQRWNNQFESTGCCRRSLFPTSHRGALCTPVNCQLPNVKYQMPRGIMILSVLESSQPRFTSHADWRHLVSNNGGGKDRP